MWTLTHIALALYPNSIQWWSLISPSSIPRSISRVYRWRTYGCGTRLKSPRIDGPISQDIPGKFWIFLNDVSTSFNRNMGLPRIFGTPNHWVSPLESTVLDDKMGKMGHPPSTSRDFAASKREWATHRMVSADTFTAISGKHSPKPWANGKSSGEKHEKHLVVPDVFFHQQWKCPVNFPLTTSWIEENSGNNSSRLMFLFPMKTCEGYENELQTFTPNWKTNICKNH